MNVLVIGNSHVGSLKRAYDNISSDIGDVKFHFVASKGSRLSSIEVREGIYALKTKIFLMI